MRARRSPEAATPRTTQPVEPLQALAEQIRLWRSRNGMTQADLAVASNISVSFISMIERAERSPSYETLIELARALEIPLSELFRAEEQAPVDDGYYRKLVDFARGAHLNKGQVEQLVSVGRAMFELPEEPQARRPTPPARVSTRRCAMPGCERPLLARGLCPSHYRRKLREGKAANDR